jgi:hypothetical protein
VGRQPPDDTPYALQEKIQPFHWLARCREAMAVPKLMICFNTVTSLSTSLSMAIIMDWYVVKNMPFKDQMLRYISLTFFNVAIAHHAWIAKMSTVNNVPFLSLEPTDK